MKFFVSSDYLHAGPFDKFHLKKYEPGRNIIKEIKSFLQSRFLTAYLQELSPFHERLNKGFE